MWDRITAGGVHHGLGRHIGPFGRCHQSSPTINDVGRVIGDSPNLAADLHHDEHNLHHNNEHDYNNDTGALHRQRSERRNDVGGGRRGNHVPW